MKFAPYDKPDGALRVLPLWGRYSRAGHIELNGSRQALHVLAAALVADESGKVWQLKSPPQPHPAPYDSVLNTLRILNGPGKVRVGLEAGGLIFTGSREMLGTLAHNIKWLAENGDPSSTGAAADYLYVEYHPDHYYLDPSSEPLAVYVEHER